METTPLPASSQQRLTAITLCLLLLKITQGFHPLRTTTRPQPQLPLPQNTALFATVGRVTAGPTMDVSSLGCGTWSWGNRLLFDYDPSQDEEIYEAYREIRSAGVTLFDTADSYGTLDLNGRAEILLGQFERRYRTELGLEDQDDHTESGNQHAPSSSSSPRPTSVLAWLEMMGSSLLSSSFSMAARRGYRPQQVATKLAPYPWRVTPGQVVSSTKGSLRRLQQPKVAILQLHWSTANYQPLQESALWEGISDAYDQGLCEAVGVSNYGPIQLTKVAQRFEDRKVPLAIAQIQYSLMTYKDGAQDMNDACDEVGCRLISYSPLCLGLLTGKYTVDNLPRSGPRRQLFRELLPGSQDLLRTLNAVADEYGKSQTQVAINWAVAKGTVPIPGARNLHQARENLGAVGWNLKADAVRQLDVTASKVSKPMIQNIFQTK